MVRFEALPMGGDDLRLVHLVDGDEPVGHLVDGDRGRDDLVAHRVLLVPGDQGLHRTVEGGGEEEGLVRALDVAQEPLDLGQEAHVGHAVGLVDHDDLDVVEPRLAPLDHVDHAPGGGHHDLGPLGQGLDLAAHVGAAVDGHDPAPDGRPEGDQLLGHLGGQLAGGHQDQGAGAAGLGLGHPLEGGQAEGEGLARTGLGLAAHVAAGQGIADGELLDRKRPVDALLGEGLDQGGIDPELLEGRRHLVAKPTGARL
jgi:hypothetical protein